MKIRKRELAKVGIFGSVDNPTVVKESDLKEIAETFPAVKKAAVKLGGHWTENRPRLGNVISVEYNAKTKTLSGEVEEHNVLAQLVDDGAYPDVSIGAKQRASDGKMYLHHLAYLGDEPPAIKDLEKGIAESLEAEDNGLAATDHKDVRYLPATSDRRLYLSDKETESVEKENKTNRLGTPEPDSPPVRGQSLTGKEQTMTEDEIAAMQAENARLKAECEGKEKLLSDSIAAQRKTEKEQLRKAAEGKVTVPELEQLMNLADSFAEGKTIELSDTDGSKKVTSPVLALTQIFAGIKPKVDAGELNLSDNPPAKIAPLASRMLGNV